MTLPRRLPVPTRPTVPSYTEEDTRTWKHESAIVRVESSPSSPSSPAPALALPPLSARSTALGMIGSGGMGSVYLARAAGSAGFSRLVAVKRLHPHLSAEKEFI